RCGRGMGRSRSARMGASSTGSPWPARRTGIAAGREERLRPPAGRDAAALPACRASASMRSRLVEFRRRGGRSSTRPVAPAAQRGGRRVRAWLARLLAAAVFGLAGTALPAHAQGPSPFVAGDHWVQHALRRLNGLGLLEQGHDPGTRSITEHRAARMLRDALLAAAGTPYEDLARAYLDRFIEEVGGGWDRPA